MSTALPFGVRLHLRSTLLDVIWTERAGHLTAACSGSGRDAVAWTAPSRYRSADGSWHSMTHTGGSVLMPWATVIDRGDAGTELLLWLPYPPRGALSLAKYAYPSAADARAAAEHWLITGVLPEVQP